MKRLLPLLLPLALLASASLPAAPKTDPALATWHQSARALTPGATLEIPDGTYTSQGSIKLEGLHGTADKPITIRAAHRGKAVIAGAAGFVLKDCQHLIMEGFTMTHDADQQAFILFNCQHVRVARCTFRLSERAKPRHWEHWVTIDGTTSHHNRIDHNLFEKKINRGSPVFVRGDDPTLVCSQHDRIDHNHFRDQPYANKENGHETIRTGGNDLGASDRSSFTIIEHNLLERCSGEDEIISIKSSDNLIRHNTLLNCRGAICLRLGNRTTVEGNFIIATEEGPAFGGIKLYGFEHRVFNNYCLGLTGRRHEAPFVLDPGTLDTPATENIRDKYDDNTSVAPTRCWIAHNTWIDCSPLQFGYPDKDRACIPADNTFIHNLIVRTGTSTKPQVTPASGPKSKPVPLIQVDAMRGLHAAGNLALVVPAAVSAVPADAAWRSWFDIVGTSFPVMQPSSTAPVLWRLSQGLSPTAPVREFATGRMKANEDIFGRPRETSSPAAGAEQFSQSEELHCLLTPADVGPEAPEASAPPGGPATH